MFQEWDEELSVIAHRWLMQCEKGHDKQRSTSMTKLV